MKLDPKTRESLMSDHKRRMSSRVEGLLQVPMIRDSVAKHSAPKTQKGFTKKVVRVRDKREYA